MAERSEAVEEQAVRDGSAAYSAKPEIVIAEDVPPGYKRTEVGVIPEDWGLIRLGDLGTFSKGQGIKREEAMSGEIPCIRYGEIYTHHNDVVRKYSSRISREVAMTSKPLKHGDLLFAGSGETKEEIGKAVAFLGEEEAYAGGDIVILRPDQGIPEFLGYLLNAPLIARQKTSKGQGDAVVHISASALSSVALPYPTEKEQRAIATALSDADALIESLDRLIAKKRAIKQAAMQQLLTGQTRLPGFTGEWETKRLGDYVCFLKSGTNSRAELTSKGSVAYLHYGDIHVGGGATLNPNTVTMPHIAASKVRHLDKLAPGDLVFVDASEDLEGVGKSVEIIDVPKEGIVAGLHTIAARFDKDVLTDGFKAYLQFCPQFIGPLRRLAAGTKVLATNRQHIASVEMELPCVAEQEAIATVLSDMDTEIEALERRRDKARQIKQGMMQQLLTGRVRLMAPQTTEPVAC